MTTPWPVAILSLVSKVPSVPLLVLICLVEKTDFSYVDRTLLLSDRSNSPTILYCILHYTVNPSFSATYSYKWFSLLDISVSFKPTVLLSS